MKKLGILLFLLAVLGAVIFSFAMRDTKAPQILENQNTNEAVVEPVPVFNPDSLVWSEEYSQVPWSKRDAHAMTVFQGKMLIMGGLEGKDKEYWKAPHKDDVWVSAEGKTWDLLVEHAPWGTRRSMGVVEFQGKLWLMGGWDTRTYKSNVWNSSDGVEWVEVLISAPWKGREGHVVTVFENKLWLFGGVRFDTRETLNDVWYSEDGINWVQAALLAPWSPRYDHTVTVFRDRLWVIGGVALDKVETEHDIWVSDDGIEWKEVPGIFPWPSRHGHVALVFQDYLWLLGGWSSENGESNGINDIWYSADGFTWKKTLENAPWKGREDHAGTVFQDRIWITGGMNEDWQWSNEVWQAGFPCDMVGLCKK